MRATCSFAPPCSGPLSVPIAAITLEYIPESVLDGDARRERRRVQLVVGVQDQAGVEALDVLLVGLLALQHVQEVPGDRLLGQRLQRPLARCARAGRRRRSCRRAPASRVDLRSVAAAFTRLASGSCSVRPAITACRKSIGCTRVGRPWNQPNDSGGSAMRVVQVGARTRRARAASAASRTRAGRRPLRRSRSRRDPRWCSRGRAASCPRSC